MTILKSLAIICLCLAVPHLVRAETANPYLSAENERVIDGIIAKMTLEEKIKLCQGDIEGKSPPSRGSAALEKFGIHPMVFYNGPRGYQMGKGTVFPSPTGQAASWDTDLLYQIGKVIASESLAGKTDCYEAPSINIIRDPLNGRNFEYFTEDPFLNGALAAAFVRGSQDAGAPVTAKHLACNNQETNRNHVNSVVDERALREIYLPGFKAVIDAGALGIMTGANRVNGDYASSNADLIGTLKNDFGFKGFILTDWNGVQETVKAAVAGTDLSMPGKPDGKFNAERLMAAVKSGEVSEEMITDKVRRLLRAVAFVGLIDGTNAHPKGEKPGPPHYSVAARAAEECMVLLKNDKVLPLDGSTVKSVALLGPHADKKFPGGGSSGAGMIYEITARAGLEKQIGKDKLRYVPLAMDDVFEVVNGESIKTSSGQPGFDAVYTGRVPNSKEKSRVSTIEPAVNFNWEMASPEREKIGSDKFSCRWIGQLTPPVEGTYTFRISSTDKGKLSVNGAAVIDKLPYFREREGTIDLKAGVPVQIEVEFDKTGPQGSDSMIRLDWMRPDFSVRFASKMKDSIEAARTSDAAIVCIGLDHTHDTEGSDRKDLTLPPFQVEFLKEIAKVNPRTIAVVYAGSVLDVRNWIGDVPAFLLAWYPGIENGNALAKILFGEVNPSGKLPITFPEKYEDSPAHPSFQKEDKYETVVHSEGVFVGYRWYDEKAIKPQFPFGFGLSYTSFTYKPHGSLPTEYKQGGAPLEILVDVTNSGQVLGTEIVQAYVRDEVSSIPRPPQELKGFSRVELKPGETKTVRLPFNAESFSYWHPDKKQWVLEPGKFQIDVGSSSRDIRLSVPVNMIAES